MFSIFVKSVLLAIWHIFQSSAVVLFWDKICIFTLMYFVLTDGGWDGMDGHGEIKCFSGIS